MAKLDYTEFQDLVEELTDEFGGKLVLTQKTRTGHNEGIIAFTTTTRKANGIVLDFTADERAGFGIQESSRKVILSPKGLKNITPVAQQETINIDDKEQNIIQVIKIQPRDKDKVVMYILEVGV